MDPVLRALLTSWDLRPEILIPLVLAVWLYARGWRTLRRRGAHRLASTGKLVAFVAGQLVLALALLSAIDSFSAQLFFMHMIQHLLLIMVAAPLVMLANPFPFLVWGLPQGKRLALALFGPRANFRRALKQVSGPGLVWLLLVASIWGWHDPGAYGAALRSDLVHDLEHITFYLPALFFWWHVVQSAPHIHRRLSRGMRIGYTLSIVPANMVAGVAISFAGAPLYVHYTTVPRVLGLTVLQDQQLGGTIMWIPGSMMYLIAAIILIARAVEDEQDNLG